MDYIRMSKIHSLHKYRNIMILEFANILIATGRRSEHAHISAARSTKRALRLVIDSVHNANENRFVHERGHGARKQLAGAHIVACQIVLVVAARWPNQQQQKWQQNDDAAGRFGRHFRWRNFGS